MPRGPSLAAAVGVDPHGPHIGRKRPGCARPPLPPAPLPLRRGTWQVEAGSAAAAGRCPRRGRCRGPTSLTRGRRGCPCGSPRALGAGGPSALRLASHRLRAALQRGRAGGSGAGRSARAATAAGREQVLPAAVRVRPACFRARGRVRDSPHAALLARRGLRASAPRPCRGSTRAWAVTRASHRAGRSGRDCGARTDGCGRPPPRPR